jgi:hypothetical protein
MSAFKYGVQAATLTPAIHIGRINSTGSTFTSKQDATDETLLAVAQYVTRNFNGAMQMTFTGRGGRDDIELTITTSTPSTTDTTTTEGHES